MYVTAWSMGKVYYHVWLKLYVMCSYVDGSLIYHKPSITYSEEHPSQPLIISDSGYGGEKVGSDIQCTAKVVYEGSTHTGWEYLVQPPLSFLFKYG